MIAPGVNPATGGDVFMACRPRLLGNGDPGSIKIFSGDSTNTIGDLAEGVLIYFLRFLTQRNYFSRSIRPLGESPTMSQVGFSSSAWVRFQDAQMPVAYERIWNRKVRKVQVRRDDASEQDGRQSNLDLTKFLPAGLVLPISLPNISTIVR